ncbi:hypothetical protein BH10PLA2_BH10PLA2_28020 [soil metagenome]
MATAAQWAVGYIRQAHADFQAWEAISQAEETCECHIMLFLQMACEKLCKTHLILAGTPPASLQSSHGYIANPLPVVIREQLIVMRRDLNGMAGVLIYSRHVAAEIELLNPAVNRARQRPDNCEYPWEDGMGELRSPLDWTFHPSKLLTDPTGRTFLKLLRAAITRLLPE